MFAIFLISHELGHFLVGKAFGVKVYEFAIGMGPKLASVLRKGTIFSVRLLPVGAFVRFAGLDEREDERGGIGLADPGNFRSQPVLRRIAIVLAGPVANFLMAVILFVLVFTIGGVPVVGIEEVKSGSPAHEAGFQPGDRIIAINGTPVTSLEAVQGAIADAAGKTLTFSIKRDNEQVRLRAVPGRDPASGRGLLGVVLTLNWEKKGVLAAVSVGTEHTLRLLKELVLILYRMVLGKAKVEVAGPIGIAQVIGETARLGIISLLSLAGLLNVNLAVLNLLPIPVLDGGWILMLLLEGIRRKPLKEEHEIFLRIAGACLLILLFLFATYSDIIRLGGRGIR